MNKEQIIDLLIFVGLRLRHAISKEQFINLLNTLYEYTEPYGGLIMFMVHLRRMEKWGLISSRKAVDEIIAKLLYIYNTTNTEEKEEIYSHFKKYLGWIYEGNMHPVDNFKEFIAQIEKEQLYSDC
jgi:hypothetical protein